MRRQMPPWAASALVIGVLAAAASVILIRSSGSMAGVVSGSATGWRSPAARWPVATSSVATPTAVAGLASTTQGGVTAGPGAGSATARGATSAAATGGGGVATGVTQTGRATFYSLGDAGLGNCSYPPAVIADHMYVAAGPADYDDAGGCGTYFQVTGPRASARVLVADKCPECEPGHLDLSPEAFAAVGSLASGIQKISYTPVRNPPLTASISVRVKTGSSAYWIGFLVMNHGNPLASVEYRDSAGAWRALSRTVYNYWLKQDGAGPGPFTLRVTDGYGNRVVLDKIKLAPDVDQDTGARLYPSG